MKREFNSSALQRDYRALGRIDKIYSRYGDNYLSSSRHMKAQNDGLKYLLKRHRNVDSMDDKVLRNYIRQQSNQQRSQILRSRMSESRNPFFRLVGNTFDLANNIIRLISNVVRGIGSLAGAGGDFIDRKASQANARQGAYAGNRVSDSRAVGNSRTQQARTKAFIDSSLLPDIKGKNGKQTTKTLKAELPKVLNNRKQGFKRSKTVAKGMSMSRN